MSLAAFRDKDCFRNFVFTTYFKLPVLTKFIFLLIVNSLQNNYVYPKTIQ
jgi:hypothetical protein